MAAAEQSASRPMRVREIADHDQKVQQAKEASRPMRVREADFEELSEEEKAGESPHAG